MTRQHSPGAVARSLVATVREGVGSARRVRPSALISGGAVGLGVAFATVVGTWLSPAHALASTLGAIGVSIPDTPSPLGEKMKHMGLAWAFGALVMFAAAGANGSKWLMPAIVLIVGAAAGLVTAYGRTSISVSVAGLLALVFSNSVLAQQSGGPLLGPISFCVGGLAYILYATIATPVLATQTKQMLLKEALDGLSAYLRAQKFALERGIDQRRAYARLLDAQVALADRLQAARNVVFSRVTDDRDRQFAAELIVIIDIFEAALSEQADLDLLLAMDESGETLLEALRGLLLLAASETDRLSRSVTDAGWRTASAIADRPVLFDRLNRQCDGLSAHLRPVVAATSDQFQSLFRQIDLLARAQTDLRVFDALTGRVDLAPFMQRSSFNPRRIVRELTIESPAARFAIRLSLALFFGELIGQALPYRAHGTWIILTIAIVMRSSYSVTQQRRNERLMGNVLGCALAATALVFAPAWSIPFIIFVSVACSHAFLAQSYLVSSIASCVMALMQIHVADPDGESVFFLMRVVDTSVGAGIAFAFSFLLPSWEYRTIGSLIVEMLRASVDYAQNALAPNAVDQAYRLSRKRAFDAISSLASAASRALAEPASFPEGERALSEFLATGYLFAAELASIQLFLRSHAKELDAAVSSSVAQTSQRIARTLSDPPNNKQTERAARPSLPPALSYETVMTQNVIQGASESALPEALARRLTIVLNLSGALRLHASKAWPSDAA